MNHTFIMEIAHVKKIMYFTELRIYPLNDRRTRAAKRKTGQSGKKQLSQSHA